MAADPPGRAYQMAYLHRKRPNFIQKGQNESRLPKTDMIKAYLHQCSARPLILFKTKIKTCLDFNFHSRPIPRQVLKWIFFSDQYHEVSWFFIPVKTNTKTSLDIGNDSRPIPRLVLVFQRLRKWPPHLPNPLNLPHPLGKRELKTSSEDKSLFKLNTT